jgi:hypothetical protein
VSNCNEAFIMFGTDPFLKRALTVFGLSEETMRGLPKSAPEKRVLAKWLRQRTTVSLRWLGERLGNGTLYAGEPGDRRGEAQSGP